MSTDKAYWAKNSNGRIEFWDGSKWNEDGPEDASLEQFRVLSCKCAPQVRAAWGSEVHAKLGNVCAFCQLPSIDPEDIPLFDETALPAGDQYQYMVITMKDRFMGGKFEPAKLQGALNAYAAEGWRLRSTVTADIPGGRNEIIFILEKAPNGD